LKDFILEVSLNRLSLTLGVTVVLSILMLIFAPGISYAGHGTHRVRSDIKRTGSFVMAHGFGSHKSDIHFHNNVCY
jgi:hypothetical protein